MNRFINILYLVSPTSIQLAMSGEKVAELARINGAKVTIMYVEEIALIDEVGKFFSERLEHIKDELMHYHQIDIDNFLDKSIWDGITVEKYVCQGKGFVEITKKVIRDRHDLVIKEESLESGVDQLAMRLVRKCPSPVWIIKSGAHNFSRVLAALDVEQETVESFHLNQKIVELSHSLATREDGKAFYIHTWKLTSESMLRSPRFGFSAAEVDQMKKTLTAERLNRLQAIFEHCEIIPEDNQVLLREGDPEYTIEHMINQLSIDVVVMGTLGRTGIPGVLIGNKAEKLLNQLSCTVLTVKPDGYLSPIRLI